MKKGKDLETDYFIREEGIKKHKLSEDRRREQEKLHDEDIKALHFMKCPKCGNDLHTRRMSYIDIDQCSSCGVLVIKPEDVEKFVAEEKSILKSFIDFFKS